MDKNNNENRASQKKVTEMQIATEAEKQRHDQNQATESKKRRKEEERPLDAKSMRLTERWIVWAQRDFILQNLQERIKKIFKSIRIFISTSHNFTAQFKVMFVSFLWWGHIAD